MIHQSEELQEHLLRKKIHPELEERFGHSIVREIIAKRLLGDGTIRGKVFNSDNSPNVVQQDPSWKCLPSNSDEIKITFDKQKWNMSIPRDQETEKEVTIIFNKKESTNVQSKSD